MPRKGSKAILITRPREEAEDFARELEAEGLTCLIEPMLEIEPVSFEIPAISDFQALIFTSANALKIFGDHAALRTMPIYVVGPNTQNIAKELRFEDIHSAPTAAELAECIKRGVGDKSRVLLHVRGRDTSYDMAEDLESDGYSVESLVVYEAEKRTVLSEVGSNAIRNSDISAVTFFSKRTAESFMACAEKANLGNDLNHIKALCISDSVVKCVQPEKWQEAYAAEAPDRAGMITLIKTHADFGENIQAGGLTMSAAENREDDMSTGPIENAREVIERFGGIRPMAKKIDVAVTTIQGWKKRNVIPATRRAAILEAAESFGVDLSDIIEGAPAANQNERAKPQIVEEVIEAEPVASSVPEASMRTGERAEKSSVAKDAAKAVADTPANKTTWIVVALVVIAALAVIALLFPQQNKYQEELDRLSALEARTQEIEGDVAAVQDQQSFFGTLIPEDLDQQLASLQEQAGQVKEQAGQAIERAQEVSADVLGEGAATLEERAQALEGHLQDLTGSPVLAGMLEKIEGLSAQPEGQSQLDLAMDGLSGIMGNLDLTGEGSTFETTLDAARGQNEALGQTFENVPATDLKAAALLLTMTQFRSSLNRDNEAFAQDLQVLTGLVGEDNPELIASLERLAPHAQSGVLTPGGLGDEFKTLAGDAVVASLKGEDVSVGERAQARFNEVFQVEKDGEMITGTETQVTLDTANKQLEAGDLEAAIATVQTLDGPAAAQMSGWLGKAEATLMAEKLKALLGQSINTQAFGAAGAAATGAIPGTSKLIQNEETGINILKRQSLPGAPGNANPFN